MKILLLTFSLFFITLPANANISVKANGGNVQIIYSEKNGKKPTLQFILSKKFGVETSAWALLNKIENYYGVEVNLSIGRLK